MSNAEGKKWPKMSDLFLFCNLQCPLTLSKTLYVMADSEVGYKDAQTRISVVKALQSGEGGIQTVDAMNSPLFLLDELDW